MRRGSWCNDGGATDWHKVTPGRTHKKGPTWDEMTAETAEDGHRKGHPRATEDHQRPPEATTKATKGHEPLGP